HHEWHYWVATIVFGVRKDRNVGFQELHLYAKHQSSITSDPKHGFSSPISPATSLSRPEKTRSQSWKLLALHSFTSRFASSVDIGLACFHRTASLYFFPADLEDAPTECRFKVGWSANRRMNLCPTEPVQPKTPHFFLGTADPILLREKISLKMESGDVK